MSITIGGVVGEAEDTGTNVLEVVLTDDVPAGTPTTTSGLIIVAACETDYIDFENPVSSTILSYPASVTDDAPSVPPYSAPNTLAGAVMDVQPDAGVASIVNFPDPTYNKLLALLGGWHYRILAPLTAGDTITIDYSHLPPLDWISARLHVITGLWNDADATETYRSIPFNRALKSGFSGGAHDPVNFIGTDKDYWDQLLTLAAARSSEYTTGGGTVVDNTTPFAWGSGVPDVTGSEDHFWQRDGHGRIGYKFAVLAGTYTNTIATSSPNANFGFRVETVSVEGPGPPYPDVPTTSYEYHTLSRRVNYLGQWDGGTAYTTGDAVTHNRETFLCIQANTGEEPDDT